MLPSWTQNPETLIMLEWLICFKMLISLETSPFMTWIAASSPLKEPGIQESPLFCWLPWITPWLSAILRTYTHWGIRLRTEPLPRRMTTICYRLWPRPCNWLIPRCSLEQELILHVDGSNKRSKIEIRLRQQWGARTAPPTPPLMEWKHTFGRNCLASQLGWPVTQGWTETVERQWAMEPMVSHQVAR